MANIRKVTCKTFLDELGSYIDEDLADELRVQVEAHLAKCPDCWVIFDETKRTMEISRSVECHPLPDDVRQRLFEALEKRWDAAKDAKR